MGIPIDGNIVSFKEKLVQQKGFIFEYCESSSDRLRHEEYLEVKQGSFSGVPIDYIRIYSTPCKHIVYSVVINLLFDSKLEGERFFNRVKETAETKYGKSYRPHELPYGYSPRTGIRIDNSKGCIDITDPIGPLGAGDYKHWAVTIHYIDKTNNTISVKEQISSEKSLKQKWDSDI